MAADTDKLAEKPHLVTVELIETVDCAEPNFPRGKLVDVIGWFSAKLAAIPAAYQASAICTFSTAHWNDSYPRIRISYTRPETIEERLARQHLEASSAEARRARELTQLAALKAKYPDEA